MKHILLFLFVLVLITVGCNSQPAPSSLDEMIAAPSLTKSTGTTSSGDVSVELTPHPVVNGQLKVDIAVNTHSVDLSGFDLTIITELHYGDISVNPMSAPQLGGHHASGTLIFPITGRLEDYDITITGIPKVPERVFEWRMEE